MTLESVQQTPPPEGDPGADSDPGPAFWLYWSHLVALFGLALSNLFLGLTLLLAPFRRSFRSLDRRRFRPVLLALGVYALLLVLSTAGSHQPRESVGELGELFNLSTLVLGLLLVRGERRIRLAIDGVVLLATAESLVGLAQLAVHGTIDLSHRIPGTFSHYMTLSGILMIADLLLCAELAAGRRVGGWRWIALIPINVALLSSLTRSAWVGVAAGFLILLLLGRRRLRLAAAGFALILLLALSQGPVAQRIGSIVDLSDPTNYDRLAMAWAGLHMVADRPILGQGPGMVSERYPLYRHPTAPRHSVPHLHDSYLQMAAERGVPAFLALLSLFAVSGFRTFRLFRRGGAREGPRADLYVGVLAAFGGFLVAALFEDSWNDTEVQRLMLFLLAVPYGLDEGEEEDPAESFTTRSSGSPRPSPGAPTLPGSGAG
ncbi:MAG: O-antigen ligase family protein [Thermoanaerobaculia bacterium]|nr:O-antigen ligase family protein [Thermoanaerobaculia bacterium]